MGAVGYLISNRAIFYAVPFLEIPSLIALSTINPNVVNYARARGASEDKEARAAGIRTLISNRPLLGFAVCAVLFHFANAAMLPQLGEMLALGRARESAVLSACVVVTQLVISLTAVFIGKKAAVWGRKPLLLIAFGVLPIGGVLFTLTSSVPLLIGIQLLVGVANAVLE